MYSCFDVFLSICIRETCMYDRQSVREGKQRETKRMRVQALRQQFIPRREKCLDADMSVV